MTYYFVFELYFIIYISKFNSTLFLGYINININNRFISTFRFCANKEARMDTFILLFPSMIMFIVLMIRNFNLR